MMLIEMKVKMGLFECMESMVRDLRHPYTPSTTVLGDNTTQHKAKSNPNQCSPQDFHKA